MIFNISIVDFLIIHVAMDFNGNRNGEYERVLRKEWTYSEFFK